MARGGGHWWSVCDADTLYVRYRDGLLSNAGNSANKQSDGRVGIIGWRSACVFHRQTSRVRRPSARRTLPIRPYTPRLTTNYSNIQPYNKNDNITQERVRGDANVWGCRREFNRQYCRPEILVEAYYENRLSTHIKLLTNYFTSFCDFKKYAIKSSSQL